MTTVTCTNLASGHTERQVLVLTDVSLSNSTGCLYNKLCNVKYVQRSLASQFQTPTSLLSPCNAYIRITLNAALIIYRHFPVCLKQVNIAKLLFSQILLSNSKMQNNGSQVMYKKQNQQCTI